MMSKYVQISGVLLIAFVLCAMLPDAWIRELHLGEVPFTAVLMAILSCVLIVRQLSNPSGLSFGVLAGTAALVAMIALGCIRGNIGTYSLKFLVADTYCFTGLLAGYAFTRAGGGDKSSQVATRIATIASITIVLTYLGIFSGIIKPMLEMDSGRLVTDSVFEAAGVLLIVLPLASVVQSGRSTSFMLLTGCAATLLSGTRSLLILTVLAAMVCFVLRPRRIDFKFVLRVAAGLALASVMYVISAARFNSNVFQRLSDTQGSSEARTIELFLFWTQVSGDLVTGQGMGSRFVSNVIVEGNPLASAPHVGIVTLLMKGGISAFLAFVMLPLFVALMVFFSKSQSRLRRAGAGSALLYVALACQSGGWNPLLLFIYGMAISVMVSGASRHVLRSLAGDRIMASQLPEVHSPLVDG
jgi:hypothetical protein